MSKFPTELKEAMVLVLNGYGYNSIHSNGRIKNHQHACFNCGKPMQSISKGVYCTEQCKVEKRKGATK